MTTEARAQLRRPPRPLINLFWKLHRLAYRVTGGRFGLTSPRTDERFGMLRLVTTGRRSGKRRETMLGYYEDGSNLVTLAMNGWRDTDPAWWLNLQVAPLATVDLPAGRRTVRARATQGAERDRLWSILQRYSGWGDDLEMLVAARTVPTPVVVLEPVNAGGEVAS